MQIVISSKRISDQEVNSVNARDLHAQLGSKKKFADWIKNKVIDNPFFEDGVDYILLHQSGKQERWQVLHDDYTDDLQNPL